MAKFKIAEMEVAPGELKFGSFKIAETRGGAVISIPMMIMNGAKDGPVVWLDTAIHGNEIAGFEVIRRIMREEVTPAKLKGTIVAALGVNPFAFQAGVHGTAIIYATTGGNLDLNAAFPGKLDGTLNERIAHRIFTDGIMKSDYVINFHSNYYPAMEFIAMTRCEDKKVFDATVAMGNACGLPISLHTQPGGRLGYLAQKAGKPGMIVELVPTGYFNERSIQIGVLGVKNVLRHLGMLEGKVEPLPGLKVPPGLYGRGFVRCNHGGLAHYRKEAGDWVDPGDVIAVIRNVYGDIVEEVKATAPGYIRTVGFGPHNEAVHEGAEIISLLAKDVK